MKTPFIRTIQPTDNPEIASVVRNTLAEFGLDKPGTVYFDKTTDHLFELFQKRGSIYYVALLNDRIIGGAGIYPSDGLPELTCELVKMYLIPEARGTGSGKNLLNLCLEFARKYGYRQVYIETMPELSKAITMYSKFGFRHLKGPLGRTGHFGCDVWMIKEI
jgi:putative acetyltransferase